MSVMPCACWYDTVGLCHSGLRSCSNYRCQARTGYMHPRLRLQSTSFMLHPRRGLAEQCIRAMSVRCTLLSRHFCSIVYLRASLALRAVAQHTKKSTCNKNTNIVDPRPAPCQNRQALARNPCEISTDPMQRRLVQGEVYGYESSNGFGEEEQPPIPSSGRQHAGFKSEKTAPTPIPLPAANNANNELEVLNSTSYKPRSRVIGSQRCNGIFCSCEQGAY